MPDQMLSKNSHDTIPLEFRLEKGSWKKPFKCLSKKLLLGFDTIEKLQYKVWKIR